MAGIVARLIQPVLFLLGVAAVSVGVALYSIPAGVIALGAGLMVTAVLMAQADSEDAPK